MTRAPKTDADPNPPPIFDIRISGHLEPRWSAWFDEMTITLADDGDTILRGPIIDQSALHGLLSKVRDLGLPLVSVTRLELDPGTTCT